MSADSYVMCYFKGKYTTLFCKCIRTKKKSYMCWMCCIFGCIVYLDELVIIGLGIRIRQGFEGEGLRVGYKTDDRISPKIKQKKRASKISLQSSLYKRRRLPTLPHCIAVPSAQTGLTSLFGMGRGGTPPQ